MLLILTKISIALTAIFAFMMGVFTLLRNSKARVHQTWFLTSIAVAFWAVADFFIMTTQSPNFGMLNVQFTFVGASLIPVFFFHFVVSFLFQEKNKKVLILVGYILAIVFIVLIYITPLILKDFSFQNNFGYYGVIGQLFYLFLIFFFVYVLYSFYLLINAYKKSDGLKRKQILYIVIGSGIGFAGGSTGFLINLFNLFPYGWLIVFLYPLLITYAIFLKRY